MRVSEYLSWHWSDAAWTAAGVLPAACVIAWGHVSVGIALSVGLLPVGLMGVRPLRRQRAGPGFVGVAFAVSLLLGSLLSRNAWVAVAGMLALPLLVSLPAVRPTARRLAFALIIPGVAIGLSFPELSDAVTLAWAIAAGVLWMVALSLLLPEHPLTVPPPRRPRTSGRRASGG